MLEKLTFEVKETPVLYDFNGEIITSNTHKAIVKAETGKQLSTMKNSYNTMHTSDFMESVERMSEISGFNKAGYSELDEGRIILAHLKNNGENFEIGGHKIEDYLVMGSSFDGRYSFFIGTSTVLLRCSNQFSKLSRMEKVRHTKSAPKRREELMSGLEVYFEERRDMYRNFEKMREVKVDPEILRMAQDYVLSIDKHDRLDGKLSTRKQNQLNLLHNDMILEMNDLGENVWALMNGVTKYTTHTMKQKERTFGNLFGNSANINKRAYEFATSLI